MTFTAKSEDTQAQLNASMRTMEVAQWKYLVKRIHKPTTARIIVEYLDENLALKARFAGVYIRARDTVQRSRARYAKAMQYGRWFARVLSWLARKPADNTAVSRSASSGCRPANTQHLVWPELITQ